MHFTDTAFSRKITSDKPPPMYIEDNDDDAPPPPPLPMDEDDFAADPALEDYDDENNEEYGVPEPPAETLTVGEWIQGYDKNSSLPFFHNKLTRKSTWTEPKEVTAFKYSNISPDEASGKWNSTTTDDGREYYYNERSRRSTWTDPADRPSIRTASPASSISPVVKQASTASARRRSSATNSPEDQGRSRASSVEQRKKSGDAEGRAAAGSFTGATPGVNHSRVASLTRANSGGRERSESGLHVIHEHGEHDGDILGPGINPYVKEVAAAKAVKPYSFKAYDEDGNVVMLKAETNSSSLWVTAAMSNGVSLYIDLIADKGVLTKQFGLKK